jgi:hypothetical protein
LQRKVLSKPYGRVALANGVIAPVPKLQPDDANVGPTGITGTSRNAPKQESKLKKSDGKKKSYCENCQARYDSFPEHVQSKRHRAFAMDPNNFVELDRIIAKLQRLPSL